MSINADVERLAAVRRRANAVGLQLSSEPTNQTGGLIADCRYVLYVLPPDAKPGRSMELTIGEAESCVARWEAAAS